MTKMLINCKGIREGRASLNIVFQRFLHDTVAECFDILIHFYPDHPEPNTVTNSLCACTGVVNCNKTGVLLHYHFKLYCERYDTPSQLCTQRLSCLKAVTSITSPQRVNYEFTK